MVRIKEEVDPDQEMAAIHRRVFANQGPAILYENVKGSPFPALSNLFGTMDRTRFIFRRSLAGVKALVRARANPPALLRSPSDLLRLPFTALHCLPRPALRSPLTEETTIDKLPGIRSWPRDGGGFITLPQVYSENPDRPGPLQSNLGMYRIQMDGNRYALNREVGLHYQIHRGIGIHHTRAREMGQELKVSIFVGGPPAHAFAAVMPLPEGLPEIAFAGGLAGRGFRYRRDAAGHLLATDADFCITGTIADYNKPEGPFGDHLGYYALMHPFPVLKVEKVYHRKDAIWPFTVVHRPPAEDTAFGSMIQEIVGPMVPASIPGLREMHAVDAAGVHPLMLAIGSERYTPYQQRKRPQELLRIAHAILGFGHASLSKYLIIAAGEDNPDLSTHDAEGFFQHILERLDPTRDLHFETCTTMDTLDYTGTAINEGSRLILAATGPRKRKLQNKLPRNFNLPAGFKNPQLVMPGILAIETIAFSTYAGEQKRIQKFANYFKQASSGRTDPLKGLPLVLLVDDAEFTARQLNNFLWVTFTRSDPARDIYGVDSFMEHKHWGCRGAIILDARIKPHHAPPLEEAPGIAERMHELSLPGRSLHGLI